jgi:RNA polymerase sigma-70 factor (family 1)
MQQSNYGSLSDLELTNLLRVGNHTAFAEIFERYEELLYNFAFKKLGDQEESKDLIQDLFVTLWNNRLSFELKTRLSSYLYRAVLNRVLDLFKHRAIKEEHIRSLQQKIELTAEGADYMIREKDIERLIEMEIAALPEKMREVFIMRRKQFLSNREIGEKLGISEQTVETHMKRALRVLRSRLGLTIYLMYILQK